MNVMNGFWAQVKENWFIIVVVGGGLIAWGANTANLAFAQSSIEENKSKIESVEAKVDAVEEDIDDISQSLTRIDTNQMHITNDVAEMKRMLELALERQLEDEGD